jgi:hypothetical protein
MKTALSYRAVLIEAAQLVNPYANQRQPIPAGGKRHQHPFADYHDRTAEGPGNGHPVPSNSGARADDGGGRQPPVLGVAGLRWLKPQI